MIVTSIRTHKITQEDSSLLKILDQYISDLKENSILAVTSKIVSITEGRLVKIEDANKDELIKQESEFFLPREKNKYNVAFSVTNNMLVVSAGIDESNGNGYYILWPRDSQSSVNKIREFLRGKFNIKNLGVIITDSRTTPFRWGVIGASIAYSGFKPLQDYIGTPDLFGRKIEHTKLNIADALAASAGLVMGEADEGTPISVITEVPMVEFVDNNPTQEELEELKIEMEDDLFAPFLENADWQKGDKS